MKISLFAMILALVVGGASLARAQEAIFIAPEPEEIPAEDAGFVRRVEGIQGIVGQILRAFRPLQLLNPFAPSFYGSGEQNVSVDDSFGQSYPSQPGVIVFGLER